ncbi:MAG: thioesterase family protein [Mycoplasmoidaceae bacterium]|nr:thioesterase family protein [Mycoplasmoidaceae bacterium]
MELKEGLLFEKTLKVTPEMSAIKVGSGLVDVFATPSLITFVEQTCSQAIAPALEKDEVTVGVEVNAKHMAPSKIGAIVKCSARILQIAKNKILFTCVVTDNDKMVAIVSHTRCRVNKEKFLANLNK